MAFHIPEESETWYSSGSDDDDDPGYGSRLSRFSSYSTLSLFSSLLTNQDDNEWPSLQSLQTQPHEQQAFALRETSKDSGIHEMTEEKRKSAKRKE
jgi:hypothetical protein